MITEKVYYAPFPVPGLASPEGLLCHGGSLEPDFLLHAYSRGIFPWFSEGDPILWWCPDPRYILLPDNFHLPDRSRRKLKKFPFSLTINMAFENVIDNCAKSRSKGTWITKEMRDAYVRLHKLGYAWSVEAWLDNKLAGGLYGVALGRAFFGESMFHFVSEASRAALWALVNYTRKKNFLFIDCQQESEHMIRMGSAPVERKEFLKMVKEAVCDGERNMHRADPLPHPLIYLPEKDEWGSVPLRK